SLLFMQPFSLFLLSLPSLSISLTPIFTSPSLSLSLSLNLSSFLVALSLLSFFLSLCTLAYFLSFSLILSLSLSLSPLSLHSYPPPFSLSATLACHSCPYLLHCVHGTVCNIMLPH